MKQVDDDIEERKQTLCERYSVIKTYVCYFGIPAEYRDDVAQDVYVAAYNSIGKLSDVKKMDNWLFRIAQRKAGAYLKRRNLMLRCETEYVPEEWDCEMKSLLADRSVTDETDRDLNEQRIMDLVAALKSPASVIIRMRFFEGYTLKEIAQKLGMNYNSVRTVERRALKKLKKEIIGQEKMREEKKK